MTVMWESASNAPGMVRYGLGGYLDSSLRLEHPAELLVVTNYSVTNLTAQAKTNVVKVSLTNRVYLYQATLTNLQPNSVYFYTAESADVRSTPHHFKTFGVHPYQVTFIAYGDTRTNPKTHASLAANFRRYAPDFILHLGDVVTDGKQYAQWGREFFSPLANVIDEIPLLPAIGNHEESGTNYLRYLHLPSSNSWYSYDVGPVHVLALDYRFEKSTNKQFAFAKADLERSTAPWKVVMLHYPVFNIGGHGTGWGHTNYLPLFHATHVDMVIAGHSHIYERFRPIASTSGEAAWPILHITSGGGGAPLTTTYAHPALVTRVATNHFMLFQATPNSLRGYAISQKNRVLDSFELTKREGVPSASYYAQVYPEEALKLDYELSPSLAATAASLPVTNGLVQVTFQLHATTNWNHAVGLKISLTPDSARYYELADSPLRAITPSLAESNRFAWGYVRATGTKKITAEGKEKTLKPPLVFQARTVAGGVETVAYGPGSHLYVAPTNKVEKLAETAAGK